MRRKAAVERLERRARALAPPPIIRVVRIPWRRARAERERFERELIAEAERAFGDVVLLLIRQGPPSGAA